MLGIDGGKKHGSRGALAKYDTVRATKSPTRRAFTLLVRRLTDVDLVETVFKQDLWLTGNSKRRSRRRSAVLGAEYCARAAACGGDRGGTTRLTSDEGDGRIGRAGQARGGGCPSSTRCSVDLLGGAARRAARRGDGARRPDASSSADKNKSGTIDCEGPVPLGRPLGRDMGKTCQKVVEEVCATALKTLNLDEFKSVGGHELMGAQAKYDDATSRPSSRA